MCVSVVSTYYMYFFVNLKKSTEPYITVCVIHVALLIMLYLHCVYSYLPNIEYMDYTEWKHTKYFLYLRLR